MCTIVSLAPWISSSVGPSVEIHVLVARYALLHPSFVVVCVSKQLLVGMEGAISFTLRVKRKILQDQNAARKKEHHAFQ